MGLMSTILGGSKSTSENLAWPSISGALGGVVNTGANAINSLGDELSGGFNEFLKNSGFNFAAGQGLDAITGGAAAKGMLRSGATTKGMAEFLDGLKAQRYENYLNQVGNVGQLGLGAGGVMTSAGSTSTQKSKTGLLSGLGALFGG